MRNINSQRKKDGKEPQEPWEYFDLIGGTSTGGIIAIMLGRLRMTIPECITAYTELSETIFKPKRSWASPFRAAEYLNGDGKFDSQALEKEIKTQIQKSKVAANDDQILLMDTESPCKVCVFALQGEDSTLAILRTYDYPNASHTLFEECKVWEACRATSAAPTFFDPVQIGPYKQSFIDGGLRYNNPIFKVYGESQEIWPNRTIVVTSIGNGEPPGTNFSGNLKQIANSIAEIVTDCDRTADDFYNRKEYMIDKGCYFRLSVTHGLGSIGLEEHDHINEITDRTEVYLSRGEPRTKLNMCIRALLQEHVPRTMLRLNNIRNDACLESLAFEMNFWKENLVSANDDTCGWLLENNNYARWIQNDDGLLWIQGKAGVGKSTLMKYIYEKMETPTADVPSLQLSFFFHACGVELQKTPLGMFRSLLLQLYEGDLTARLRIRKVFDKSSEDGMVEVKWEKIAEELFSSVIRQISGSKKVTIFIDALDEAGEVVANDVASYFIILYKMVQQSNGTVKICFSSRPHPIISAKVADNQIITVEHENGRGIRLFVQNEFEGNLQDGRPIKSGEASLKLEGDIAARADVQKIRVKGETERPCDDMSILEFWIGDILMQKGTFDTKLRINLHELIRFVIDEYDFGYPLRHILTVTGSPIDAFTGTAESYVKCQWGENGLRILDWMSQLITNRDIYWVGSSKTRHNSDVAIVRISGTPDEIASTAMQLTWMATVFRKPSEEGLVVSRAKMEYIGYQEATGNSEEKSYRGFTIKLQSLNPVGGNNDRGGCWNPIFRSFVIADGFQIPSRPQLFSGIELPLSLLAVLAQVDYPLQYLDSCVLKGRKSAVVPVSSFDTIDGRWIQWHLIQSDNESDLSMEVVHRKAEECELVPCPVSFEYFVARLDDNDNEDRHFLGLYPSAAINLGTQGSHAEDIKSVRDIRLARGPKIIWKRNISPSIGIPLGALGDS
ncbi:hypothetical protein V498_07664 [Pseudogymnoascus sp. VKM F-4517 (FW-2822)]|nr:hypothetical protein V498_07664 [Pseudogymnoascus sp. VKM F-4517 (FW-2822)]